jgi:hypothetical protein
MGLGLEKRRGRKEGRGYPVMRTVFLESWLAMILRDFRPGKFERDESCLHKMIQKLSRSR